MKPHLTHLFLQVGDLQKARRFWTEAVGLSLQDDGGEYIRVGGNGGFAIGIEQGPVSLGGPEINVRVEDADATVARLRDAGVTIAEAPADMPWGARHA